MRENTEDDTPWKKNNNTEPEQLMAHLHMRIKPVNTHIKKSGRSMEIKDFIFPLKKWGTKR